VAGYYAYADLTGATTLTSAHHIATVNTSGTTTAPSNAYTVTLPAASTALKGKEYIIFDINGNANNRPIGIAVASGDYLNDVLNGTYTINVPREQVRIYCSGTRWYLG
jgi:hypothetical protein